MMGRNLLLACLAATGLSGCLGGGDVTRAGTSPFWFNASAPRAVVLAGDVVVTGPKGFCIDPRAIQNGDGVYFALLGSCASLSNSASHGKPARPAVLSISLGQQGGIRVSETADALATLLGSPEGRGLLATDGSANSVTVISTEVADGIVLVHAIDPGLTRTRNLEPEYWRGLFDLKGRIATVNVFSLPGRQLSEAAAMGLASDMINALRLANASEPQQPESVAEG